MGHSTSSGRSAPSNERIQRENLSREEAQNVAEELRIYGYETSITGEGDRRTVTAERRAALDFNSRSRAIQNMVFEEYGSGSRAVVPGVGTATVTYDETRGGYVGQFHLDREGVTKRVGSRSETLAKMERTVKAAMLNANRRGKR